MSISFSPPFYGFIIARNACKVKGEARKKSNKFQLVRFVRLVCGIMISWRETEERSREGRGCASLFCGIMKAKTYRQRIIKAMKSLGTYKPEFGATIDELARMYEELDKVRELFAKTGGNYVIKHTNKNGSENLVKNPVYHTIEGMQARILTYNKELGLTPAGLKKIRSDESDSVGSGLMEALLNFEEG